MLKRLIGLAIVVLAAWGSGCTSEPAPEEPAPWSAIKFVPQETAPETDRAADRKINQ
jgi:hypothetical protein